ncbi:Semaphorin-3E [Acipenser ruthenus]|uniref:Semaphorin-3E n=1 Tax=Acipenser ruthenus TaxID=7906 RepID=A0A444U681_ACIRT|nr:Semaphorin-3E [Acipenser ruthenus]
MFLDEYQERLFVGGRDLMYSLNLDRVNEEYREIHWPSTHTQVEKCRMEGKDVAECANFIRVFHEYNRTHLLACGTGAFDPVCAYVRVGHWTEDRLFKLEINMTESGRGRCPFEPNSPCVSTLKRGVSEMADERLVYGIEHNSTLLECMPRSPQANVLWFIQRNYDNWKDEVKTDERIVKTDHGLLFLKLHRMDGGTYFCQTVEHGFIHTVTKITLEVLEEERIEEMFNKDDEEELLHKEPCPALQGLSHGSNKVWYKEFLQLIGYSNFQRVEEYCMRVWCTDKKRKKLKTLPAKWKYSQVQERRTKTRGERHRSPRHAQDT